MTAFAHKRVKIAKNVKKWSKSVFWELCKMGWDFSTRIISKKRYFGKTSKTSKTSFLTFLNKIMLK